MKGLVLEDKPEVLFYFLGDKAELELRVVGAEISVEPGNQ
jgi:hypothetical protein